ncbi:hypothetical protein AB0B89_00540 [Sphaerisporangium sp. NPDC049002]|uniref:hypothetical protein n=1 Tax=unclassified Sphaerisporangium TaxID=2630420 RepID=UPI0033F8480B
MRARSGRNKAAKADQAKRSTEDTTASLPEPGFSLPGLQAGFPQPVIQPGAIQGSPQPERQLPPAPRRIPVPPAPVRRVTPPRRQPKGR